MLDKIEFTLVPIPDDKALDEAKKRVEKALKLGATQAFQKATQEYEEHRKALHEIHQKEQTHGVLDVEGEKKATAGLTSAAKALQLHLQGEQAARAAERAKAREGAGKVSGHLEKAGDFARNLGHNPIAGAANTASSLLSALGPLGIAAGGGIAAAGGIAAGIRGAAGSTPSGAAAAGLFDRAMQDVVGVIGKSLVPALQAMIPWVRLVGDTLASILPSAEQMEKVLRPLDDALEAVKDAIDPLIPIFQEYLSEGLTEFGEELKLLVPIVEAIAEQFKLWEPVLRMLVETTKLYTQTLTAATGGITKGWSWLKEKLTGEKSVSEMTPAEKAEHKKKRKNLKEGASVGAGAPVQASYTGIAEYGQEMIKNAFAMGAGQSYEEKTADNTERMKTLMEELVRRTSLGIFSFPQHT